MLAIDMMSQMVIMFVSPLAFGALERSFFGVAPNVPFQIIRVGEISGAYATLIGRFPYYCFFKRQLGMNLAVNKNNFHSLSSKLN